MSNFEKHLQNPVWYALQETHENFLVEYNGVKFYDPKICPFGAFTTETNNSEALNKYAENSEQFFLVSENRTPTFDSSKIELVKKMDGCQMVLDNLVDIDVSEEIIPLTEEHIDEIYNLVWLVMPGYYRKRTFDMGDYYGIFKDNKLVAITGQRMQTDTFIEISAVVTHPDYTRRGFAKQLTYHVTKEIIKSKKTPILHTNKGNPAIQLYEKLGFKLTRDMNWWLFARK